MKTAISVEGDLLTQADQTARTMGLSRSGLFSLALKDFLKRRQQEEIVEKLNRVYGRETDPSERRTVAKMKEKFRATIKDRW